MLAAIQEEISFIHYNKKKEGLDGQFEEKKDNLPGNEKSNIYSWPCG